MTVATETDSEHGMKSCWISYATQKAYLVKANVSIRAENVKIFEIVVHLDKLQVPKRVVRRCRHIRALCLFVR